MTTFGGLLGDLKTAPSMTVTTAPAAPDTQITFDELLRIIRRANRADAEDVARADEAEVDALCYDQLEQLYGAQLAKKVTLSERSHREYAKSAKKFAAFCKDVTAIPVRSCPARPGIVASWLHSELESGASGPVIRRHAAAISYMHRINEEADPTDDPLVKAIVLRASTMSKKQTKQKKTAGKKSRHTKLKGN